MAFSLLGYIEANFDHKVSGDFVYFRCVFCDKPWKLWVNVAKERPDGWCFRCQTWTDAVKLVMAHRGIDRFAALKFIKEGQYGESLATALQRSEPKKVAAPARVLPDAYEPIGPSPADPVEKLARAYLAKRGVSQHQIAEHGIGYCGVGKYHGCVIVPIKRGGIIAYFVARAFLRADGVRYLNPSKAEIGTGKSEVLFNFDRASRSDDVFLVEGVFDAMAMGERAIAIFGKDLSDVQTAMILGAQFGKVGVCLDPDAEREQNELVQMLVGFGVDAYPMKALGKDPSESGGRAEVGKASFLDMIRTRMGR